MLTAGASASSLRDMQVDMMALLSEIKAEMTVAKKLLTKCEVAMSEFKEKLDQLAAEEVTQTLEVKHEVKHDEMVTDLPWKIEQEFGWRPCQEKSNSRVKGK